MLSDQVQQYIIYTSWMFGIFLGPLLLYNVIRWLFFRGSPLEEPLKSIQTFVTEFPKLELGDQATRASRLISWRAAVEQADNSAGPHLIQWCTHLQ